MSSVHTCVCVYVCVPISGRCRLTPGEPDSAVRLWASFLPSLGHRVPVDGRRGGSRGLQSPSASVGLAARGCLPQTSRARSLAGQDLKAC